MSIFVYSLTTSEHNLWLEIYIHTSRTFYVRQIYAHNYDPRTQAHVSLRF